MANKPHHKKAAHQAQKDREDKLQAARQEMERRIQEEFGDVQDQLFLLAEVGTKEEVDAYKTRMKEFKDFYKAMTKEIEEAPDPSSIDVKAEENWSK